MADVHDKETRRRNMSRIRGRDTVAELIVRKFLSSKGIRYRLYVKALPGKPDIVISKFKTIVDVRGCFWHRHKGCRFGDQISSESNQIIDRVKSAALRDIRNEKQWQLLGWKVITVWERCELEA